MSRNAGSWLQFGQEWRKTVGRKLEGKISTGGTEGMGRRGEPDEVAKGGFVSGVG